MCQQDRVFFFVVQVNLSTMTKSDKSKLCCVRDCNNKGNRLASSLKTCLLDINENMLRVCEQHYRKDLRYFQSCSRKKNHETATETSRTVPTTTPKRSRTTGMGTTGFYLSMQCGVDEDIPEVVKTCSPIPSPQRIQTTHPLYGMHSPCFFHSTTTTDCPSYPIAETLVEMQHACDQKVATTYNRSCRNPNDNTGGGSNRSGRKRNTKLESVQFHHVCCMLLLAARHLVVSAHSGV